MSDEAGAFGAFATAALVADTVTPSSGHAGHVASSCANCGMPVTARFCANCGQPAHLHRSLLHVGEELLHGLTHFDGKAWQTLPLLLLRPGKLTRDYVYGQRARFIPPVALFLLTVFLMFFAFSFIDVPAANMGPDIGATRSERVAQSATARQTAKSAAAEIAAIDADIAAARAKADAEEVKRLTAGRSIAAAAAEVTAQLQARAELAVDHPDQAKGPVEVDWIGKLDAAIVRGEIEVETGNPTRDGKLRKALANPELTLNKLEQKTYKFSFLLIPLSLPWLWLMFAGHRGVHLYDHAVFALYSLSFMSLLLVGGVLAFHFGGIAASTLMGIAALVVPAHLFVQLKGAYRLGVWSAAWRTAFLLFGALLSLVFFGTSILLLGLGD